MDATPADVTLRFEMGCVAEEFHRRLPAVASVEYDTMLAQFSHVEDGRSWRLRLIDPRERRIAAVRLPVVDVEFVFQGYTQAEIDLIMARFFAHFRRGGG
ncbi:MAG: hypothetical protein ABSC95_07080 [Acetobacteraceae bacterium]|jgi:hypothetical protein